MSYMNDKEDIPSTYLDYFALIDVHFQLCLLDVLYGEFFLLRLNVAYKAVKTRTKLFKPKYT